MCSIRLRLINPDDDALDLISASPLHVAGVLVDSSHVLPHLRFDRLQEKRVDWVESVGEDEFRPGEDAQLVASRVEVIAARKFVRGLVRSTSPDTQLQHE